jgi:hypothetical protein
MIGTAVSQPVSNPSAFRRTTLRVAITSLLACAAGAVSFASQAVSVLPQATGFGIDTPAGRGGTVHKVINLNESGAGSLRACVEASGPRVCVFEVSGTIKMTKDLIIRNPKITIAGQTAPSPGVNLRGGALWISTSDVLIQHMRIRVGDDPGGPDPGNRDALKISASSDAPIARIVVDHCSFSWSVDEVASAIGAWDNLTLSNNIFGMPLNDSIHPEGPHGYGVLLEDGRASFIGNLFVSNRDRNPHSRAGSLLFANNVVYNPGYMVKLGTTGSTTNSTVIGNHFIPGPDSISTKAVQIRSGGEDALPSTSKVYLEDNKAPGSSDDPWAIAGYYAIEGDYLRYKTSTPPAWPSNFTRLSVSNDLVKNSVLKNAGARPADRDSTDKLIVEGVKNGTGRVINCVAANGTARCEKNGGGWPTLANNRRTLTLPASPNTVTASGYTNLELWLHKMSATVEGKTAGSPPVSPQLVSVK